MKTTLIVVAIASVLNVCFAQQPYSVLNDIATIHAPRPVAELANLIQERYGIPVNYEDSRTVFAEDIVDETAPEARARNPQIRALGRRWGTLEFALTPLASNMEERLVQAKSLVAVALEQHVSRSQNGVFEVVERNGRLSILPKSSRGRDGRLQSDTSPLDVSIRIPASEKSAEQCLDLILAELDKVGAKVVKGVLPSNYIAQARGTCVAEVEPARNAIERILNFRVPVYSAGMQRPIFVWRLYYGIKEERYVLNIVPATQLVRSRFGGYDHKGITTAN